MLRQRSKWWVAIVVALTLVLVSSTALAAGKGGNRGQGGSQGGGQQNEDRGPSGSGNGDQDDQDEQGDQDDQDNRGGQGEKGDKGDKGNRDDQDDQGDQDSQGDQGDQDSQGDRDDQGDKDEPTRGDADQGGRLNLTAIKASIAALTDETMKAKLTGLVTAYETALANYKTALQTKADKATVKNCREALKAARKALLVALKNAKLTAGQSGKIPGNDDHDQWKAPPALDLTAIKAAIAALTDETVKANLTGLVTAYETALDNYQAGREADADDATMQGFRTALDAARSTLLAALKEAGITVTLPDDDEDDQWEAPRPLNLDAIKAIIAALTDETVKANLTGLVTAYETALANYDAAVKAGADEATMEAARAALCTARKALLAALKDVGATVGQPKGPEKGKDNPRNQTPSLNLPAIQAAIASLTDETVKANLTGLVTAYETALAKLEAAKDANADPATLKSGREALGTARKTLQTALKNAGIWDASTTPSAHSTVSTQQTAGGTSLWGSVRQLFSNWGIQFR